MHVMDACLPKISSLNNFSPTLIKNGTLTGSDLKLVTTANIPEHGDMDPPQITMLFQNQISDKSLLKDNSNDSFSSPQLLNQLTEQQLK